MDKVSRLGTLNPSQLKSLYLHDLAFTAVQSPLAKVYTLKYQDLNRDKDITYPDSYYNGTKTCLNCNQINIPGRNVRISISKSKLVYRCLGCQYKNTFVIDTSTVKSQLLQPLVNENLPDKITPVADKVVDHKIMTHKTGAIDKKKKKKKQTSLSAMLEQKKQQNNAVTLDLMEFMKQ